MSAQIRRSPAPPQQPGIANHSHVDYTPPSLYFHSAGHHPTLGTVAVLRTALGDELICRPNDALLTPEIETRLTVAAKQILAGLMLYGGQ